MAAWDTTALSQAASRTHSGRVVFMAALAGAGWCAVGLAALAVRINRRFEARNACEHCGYPRRGVAAPRCPECGRAY